MDKNLTSELDHIKNVVEMIEKKVDLNSQKISGVESTLKNQIEIVQDKVADISKLITSNETAISKYLTEINNVTLFELKTTLKNQIIESAGTETSTLAALISNLENIINTNISVYSETELKLLKEIKSLIEKK